MKTNTKYKIGDIVQIKSKEWYNNEPKEQDGCVIAGHNSFVREMTKYLGKTAKIVGIYKNFYLLDIDNRHWSWTDEMILKKLKNQLPKSGFYKEDDSYVYVCGGKILFGGGVDAKNKIARLDISVSKNSNRINTIVNQDDIRIDNSKPKTYIWFYSKDSIDSLINTLNKIKKYMTW